MLVLLRQEGQRECTLWLCHAGEACRAQHPSVTENTELKRYQVELNLGNIESSNLEDEAVWWMLVYLRVYGNASGGFRGSSHFYNVLLPHLLGKECDIATKGNVDECGKNSGWPFVPLNGTSESLCCRGCLRVLLRQMFGCEQSQIDDIFGDVLSDLVKELEEDIKECEAREEGWLRADALMVQSACRQMARQSLQRQPSAKCIQGLKQILSKVDKIPLIDPQNTVPPAPVIPSKLDLDLSVEYVPFPHFELLTRYAQSSSSMQRGKALAYAHTNLTDNLYLSSLCQSDLVMPQGSCSESEVRAAACVRFKKASVHIKVVEKICREWKSGSDAARLKNLNICSLIESLFSRLPLPCPSAASLEEKHEQSTFWDVLSSERGVSRSGSRDQLLRRDQRQMLRTMYDLTVIYTSAWLPLTDDRISQSTNLITMGAMLSIFDAVLRVYPNDWSKDEFIVGDIVSGRTHKSSMGWSTDAYDGSRDFQIVFQNLHVDNVHLLGNFSVILPFTPGVCVALFY